MTQPRFSQVCLESTRYYHCITRCIRRTFLCGNDPLTGKSYEHRKQWVIDKLTQLSHIFAIDVCGYAVMSDRYHLVLHIDKEKADKLSNRDVAKRWTRLFHSPPLVQKFFDNVSLSDTENTTLVQTISSWRQRLYDLSWFMRTLNESLARMANQEEGCTGRFWSGRYRSQSLLDEAAVVACMSHVDLLPEMSPNEDEAESSIYSHTTDHQKRNRESAPIVAPSSSENFAIAQQEYAALITWTKRAINEGRPTFMPRDCLTLLKRIGIKSQAWVDTIKYFQHRFYGVVGSVEQFKHHSRRLGKHWFKGISAARKVYCHTGCTEPIA